MGRPTTRRGAVRGSSAGQSFYTDAVQRRERMCRAVSSVAMGGGRNGPESTWLITSILASVLECSSMSWRVQVSWRVLACPGESGVSSVRVRHTIGRIWQLRYLVQCGPRRPAPPLRWATGGFPLPLLPLSRYPPTQSTRSQLSVLFICSPLPSERVCTTCSTLASSPRPAVCPQRTLLFHATTLVDARFSRQLRAACLHPSGFPDPQSPHFHHTLSPPVSINKCRRPQPWPASIPPPRAKLKL